MWDEEGRIFKNELKKIGYNEQQFETLNIEPVVTKKLLCLKHRKIKIEDAAKISSIKFKDEDDALTNAIKVIKIEQEARKHWTKLGREKVYTYELSQDIYKKTYDLQSKILIQFEEKMNEVRKINRELFIQGELKVGTTEQELIEIMSERINVKKRKEIKMRDIVLMKHNYPRLQEIYKKQNKEFLENEKETIKLKEKFELIEEKISEYYFKRNEQSRLFLLNVLDTKREIEKFETLEVMNFKKEHLIKVEERIEEVKKQLSYLEQMTI